MSPRRYRRILACAATALLLSAAPALADSGGATIESLPESGELEGFAQVSHTCYEGQPCVWFAAAAAYSASAGCPDTFDATHGVWQSPVEKYGIKTVGSFAFDPVALGRTIILCLYVYSEGSYSLVGQSHPFDRATHREVLPQPAPAPKPPPVPTLHHSCGEVVARAPAYEIGVHHRAYAVFIRRGRMSCALARRTMASYLNGKGIEHDRNNVSKRYWTLAGGWRCGESTDGGHCTRGGPPARDWIEAFS
jgi:hypothetical protein